MWLICSMTLSCTACVFHLPGACDMMPMSVRWPTHQTHPNQQATSCSDTKKSQALAWWRNLWKLAISLQSSQGTSGVWGRQFVSDVDVGNFVQKSDPFLWNGILIQCGNFFLDFKKNAYIFDVFSKLRTPELRNSLHQKPYDLLAFHGIIITTSQGGTKQQR